jgi:hypothetical protein
MPEPMALLTAVALMVPWRLADRAGREVKPIGPVGFVGVVAAGLTLYVLVQASRAGWDDAAVRTHLFAMIGMSLLAMALTLIEGAQLHAKIR